MAIAGGSAHSLATTASGAVYAWGSNSSGQLGNGTTTSSSSPVQTSSLSSVIPGRKPSFTYNGDGTLASSSSGGVTSHFTYDVSGALPLMLSDGATSYIYDDEGVPIEQIGSSGTALYYHGDQQGSTRLLTDANGSVAATYTFDAYGNTTAHTGTASTPLLWQGQYLDQDSGLYYFRARYYDPQTAQFITRDPFDPLTRQPYLYVGGNPLNQQDLSGLCFLDVACGVQNAISGAVSDAADTVSGALSSAGQWVSQYSGSISIVTGAVALIPGPTEPVFGVISAVTGAISGGRDISEGQDLSAALDFAGAGAGVIGVARGVESLAYEHRAGTIINDLRYPADIRADGYIYFKGVAIGAHDAGEPFDYAAEGFALMGYGAHLLHPGPACS